MIAETPRISNKNNSSSTGRSRKLLSVFAAALLIVTAILILRWNYASDEVQFEKAGEDVIAADHGDKSGLVDINKANADILVTLPGIGEVLANRIIEYRTSFGPFKTPADIMNVDGIGAEKFAGIIDLITVNMGDANENSSG